MPGTPSGLAICSADKPVGVGHSLGGVDMWFAGREAWVSSGNPSERSVRAIFDCARRRRLDELHGAQLALELLRQRANQRRQAARSCAETPTNSLSSPAAAPAASPRNVVFNDDDRGCPV
eukprot:5682954-Pyramimonas_sp.AAC.1